MDIIIFIPTFIIAVILAFYIPGRVVLGNQNKLSGIGMLAVSVVLGIVLWGWQGYLFGFLHLRLLSYLYLLVFAVIFIKKRYYFFNLPKIKITKPDLFTILMVAIGIFSQTFQFVRNGQMTSLGLFLSKNNNPDHTFHVSLVEELVKRFPPHEPGMYGILLTNYHFWFHFVTAEIIRVFHLPIFPTQFIGMYAIGPILLAFLVYVFAKSIYDSKLFINLLFFFVYFSGDAIGWFMVYLKHQFSLDSGWLFEDGTNLMDAPGRGFAVIICFAAMYLLYVVRQQKNWKNIFIIGILFGSLIGFKIYIGIPFMLGLFVLAFFEGLKRNLSVFWIFIIASVFSLIQFLPFNSSSGGLFLVPFDIPREFFAQQAFGLSFLDLRWNIYFTHHNNFRLFEYGILMSIGYLLIQFSIKFLGIIPLRRAIKTIGGSFYIFLYSTLCFSLILGLFFFQKVGGANIWEFFMATSVILAIIFSLNVALYLPKKNKVITAILLLLIFIIIIPRWLNSTARYFRHDYQSGFHGVSNQDLESYNYLKDKTNPNSLILVMDRKKSIVYSSIVSVITQRNLFLSGEGVSQLVTPEIERRRKEEKIIEESAKTKEAYLVLKRNKINYVLLYKDSLPKSNLTNNENLSKFFDNSSVEIFKVN